MARFLRCAREHFLQRSAPFPLFITAMTSPLARFTDVPHRQVKWIVLPYEVRVAPLRSSRARISGSCSGVTI